MATLKDYQILGLESGVNLTNYLLYVLTESFAPSGTTNTLLENLVNYTKGIFNPYLPNPNIIYYAIVKTYKNFASGQVLYSSQDSNFYITDMLFTGHNDGASICYITLVETVSNTELYNFSIKAGNEVSIPVQFKTPIKINYGRGVRIDFSGGTLKGQCININGNESE